MNMEQYKLLQDWINTRPPEVQVLAKEFPIGMILYILGETLIVIGYTEDDELIVSNKGLDEDYDQVLIHKKYVCAKHLRS